MTTPAIRDAHGRPLRDLRISVTDRCNFRCTYCMPKQVFGPEHRFLPRQALLSYEEIERSARLFAELGIKKLRITGGEPLIREGLDTLVVKLAAIPGIEDLSMTSNGSLLSERRAYSLREAGLQRMTISLDAIEDRTFSAMNGVDFSVAPVLQAIDHAGNAGLGPVKINMVVKKGVNEHMIVPMAEYFRGTGHILRFIEFMDVGNSNGWLSHDVVTASEIIETIDAKYPLIPADPNYTGEVASRWKYTDGGGEIGVIASVTQPFCGDCSRLRLSAEGRLYTCLFAGEGYDLREPLRDGATDAALQAFLRAIWSARHDRYSESRNRHSVKIPKVEMSYIGG